VLKPSQIANRFVTLASNKILIHSFESQRLTGDIHIDGDASGCLSATLRWAWPSATTSSLRTSNTIHSQRTRSYSVHCIL